MSLGIDDLPFEILCDVFDYLPLEDIKTAALVCHRWNQIVFSELYIKRFRLVINLNESLIKLRQMAQILEKSDREYYSIILKVNLGSPLTEARLKIVKFVVRIISEYAESLYFNMADLRLESCVSERLLRSRKLQLFDTRAKYIPLGMGLKESMLAAICEYATDLVDLVIAEMNINNPKALEKMSLLAQLKLLLISDYYPYVRPASPPISLPNLENLSLINVTDESNFYFKADSLKRYFIHTNGTDAPRTMQSIAENINGISRLCVHFTARTIRAEQIFEYLDRFPNLNTFELGGVAIPAEVLKDLNPRNRVQKLIFVECHLETIALHDLTSKLRFLRQLVFDSCFLFHKQEGFQRIQYDDLEPVRRALPNLQVLLDYN
ncbi:uncharacterized protein LOC129728490 [Wyeomyia smithii]|uniref:uncharacterized protein LOC129728490 n=1 Tax=Wyeomyia smithii TaxID=174621 RepID=UPI002467E4C5|nr:uncharacterized protein LOC129728490 [Wyeomyia smithii]